MRCSRAGGRSRTKLFQRLNAINLLERLITAAFRPASTKSAHNSRINRSRRRAVMRKIVLSLDCRRSGSCSLQAPLRRNIIRSRSPTAMATAMAMRLLGQVRALQARIDNVQRQIDRLDRRDVGDRKRRPPSRRGQQYRTTGCAVRARGGLNPYEARRIEYPDPAPRTARPICSIERTADGATGDRWDAITATATKSA